jgi:hypothetical protein
MTVPALLFALLVALLYGALYHFVRGGGVGRLLLFFILSMIGFALGHLVGLWRGWVWIPVGSINLGLSSVGSLFILVFGDWLTRIEMREESKV